MLELLVAARADTLVGALAERLSTPAADPFASELVAVDAPGLARYITQRLAQTLGARGGHRDGVCANIELASPERLLMDALTRACGIDPASDPWRGERLMWALFAALGQAREQDWLKPLTRHFGERGERQLAYANALAALFERYARERPEMLATWAQHEGQVEADGYVAERWQARLWWRVRGEIGTPSPAEQLDVACERLIAAPELLDLPQRITFFALMRLGKAPLRVLRALAARRDVCLMLPRPCAGGAGLPRHPLLRSWGSVQQRLWEQLVGSEPGAAVRLEGDGSGAPDAPPPATLLAALQHDIRADRRPPGAPKAAAEDRRLELQSGDHSISVHVCHGRARQVEVLREAILHRLKDDPTLEPHDVLVMCPELAAFAPLVEATFGSAADAPRRAEHAEDPYAGRQAIDLPVRLAGRPLRDTNPLLGALSRLLELCGGRMRASEVLDFADSEPVRRRFGFDDEELAQIRAWVAAAEIHWGIDAQARAPYKLESVPDGSWAAGMQRLALGVALSTSSTVPFVGVLPAVEIGSEAIDLLGRFAELLERLTAAVRELQRAQSIGSWLEALSAASAQLTQSAAGCEWQRDQLEALLDEIRETAAPAAPTVSLQAADIRALITARLTREPANPSFFSGRLTLCGLAPMHDIPHRVICLLGLDDGAFSRNGGQNGDDLLLERPEHGDPDPRAEDRQLLLDALLAAQDALIITYSGHDERTNVERAPAVPLGELLDVIDATARARPGCGARAREQVVVSHPLQPFDGRCFSVGQGSSPAGEDPWSFDRAALEGALALRAPRDARKPFLSGPLPAPEDERGVVELDELVRFITRPARAFLRARLGITLAGRGEELRDALGLELDTLGRWRVGQRLLEALEHGIGAREAALAEIARGTLPPGALGEQALRPILAVAQLLSRSVHAHVGAVEPTSIQAAVGFADGTRLSGTVAGVRRDVLVNVSYSRLDARDRLAAWVRLLALCAAHPERAFEAVTIGRAPAQSDPQQKAEVCISRLRAPGEDASTREALARVELEKLLALRAQGLRAPLQLPALSTYAFADAVYGARADALEAARAAWCSRYRFAGEDSEAEHRLLFADGLDWDALGERALELWQPLLERETVELA